MKIQLAHKFKDIISIDNLLLAWQEFIKGKRKKKDVQEFQFSLMDNIFSLYFDLVSFTYRHGGYQAFNISDPKPRNIHKASVRDRLLHRAIYTEFFIHSLIKPLSPILSLAERTKVHIKPSTGLEPWLIK